MSRYDLDFTFDANLIAEWVDSQSDFAFELKVVETLHALCARTHFSATITHGGSYVDPVSGKHREHDVLFYAPSDMENVYQVMASVECKNLNSSCPVVILRKPRATTETGLFAVSHEDEPNCFTGFYMAGEPVGKHVAQLRRHAQEEKTLSHNSEIFEKWSQALHSLDGLVQNEYDQRQDRESKNELRNCLFFPVVVVPNETLWVVDFAANGKSTKPEQVERCSLYVHQRYKQHENVIFAATHVEFLTVSGLHHLVKWLEHPEDFGKPNRKS